MILDAVRKSGGTPGAVAEARIPARLRLAACGAQRDQERQGRDARRRGGRRRDVLTSLDAISCVELAGRLRDRKHLSPFDETETTKRPAGDPSRPLFLTTEDDL